MTLTLSESQRAEILTVLWTDGALSLSELQPRLHADVREGVPDVLEQAHRRGYVAALSDARPDGSLAPQPRWILTPAGRDYVIDARSPFPKLARRLAADAASQLARTWIPIVILVTAALALKGRLAGWGWVLLIEFSVLLPGAWLGTWLVNRRVRRSVLAASPERTNNPSETGK